MQRNIAAFTAIGNCYPEYVSINEQPTGNVTIHVRAAPIDGAEGNLGHIELWPEQWAELKRQILAD